MNLYEMIPMTYPELKTMRSLIAVMRCGPLWESLELDSMTEKLDAAIKRVEQRTPQELTDADVKNTR